MTSIHAITPADHDEWRVLWDGYLTFYESAVADDITANTFRRITEDAEIHGAIARDDEGRTIGFVHWLTHPATWSRAPYCYLEDLFVAQDMRGSGAGGALIAHVRSWAEQRGCAKVYWITQDGNETARRLYDKVATHTGFTHYQIDL